MRLDGELLLVGCGKMGGAMLEGGSRRPAAGEVVIVEPEPEIGAALARRGLRHVLERRRAAGGRSAAGASCCSRSSRR